MKAVAKRLNQDMMQKKIHSDMKQEMKWQAELKKENVKREKNIEAFKKEQAENKKTTSL
jgi:hypothetical protein